MPLRILSTTLAAAAALSLAACQTAAPVRSASADPAPRAGHAKNVILFIGDGMGISTITAARILAGQQKGQSGEDYVLPFERFGNVALVKTYETDAQVPDSAGTATAMNSGTKTRMGLIGMGPDNPRGECTGNDRYRLPQIARAAHDAGKAVGIVTTTRITHATPAAVYAHAAERDWEGDGDLSPNAVANGCTDIASQLVAFPFDVALGGGAARFFGKDRGGARTVASADLPDRWAARTGGAYVTTEAALAAAPAGKPVLGLFAPSHMTYMLDRKADTTEPTLTQMTAAAIAHLSRNPRGYYAMIEGGRIDHGHHMGQAGYALTETIEFANAIQYAIDHTDPAETLILVTADHSHVFTMSGYPKRGNPILGLVVPPVGGDEEHHGGDGNDPTLAADGKPYTTLGYANGPSAVSGVRGVPETGLHAHQQSTVPLGAETHSGEDVALYASGPGASRVHGTIEQNRIYDIMMAALGLKPE